MIYRSLQNETNLLRLWIRISDFESKSCAAQSVNPIPIPWIYESDSVDSRLRFCGFVPFENPDSHIHSGVNDTSLFPKPNQIKKSLAHIDQSACLET
ncbi:hypothetical protein AVEN_38439-1 [Araneus ventricosus]|uniref:Uncharacterized protein n=1 Tax=Araneus ventricosus TaxID=182803 RepID=A0A4Y2NMT0_ARAVE|nr:hypothetical protein AVEN_38439-1 [Araneus ventricosus]